MSLHWWLGSFLPVPAHLPLYGALVCGLCGGDVRGGYVCTWIIRVNSWPGPAAGLGAQSICFPLDTVRRRLQLAGTHYNGVFDAFKTIVRTEGVRGLYKGMAPNAVKVVPNNAVRFFVYDFLKQRFGTSDKSKMK